MAIRPKYTVYKNAQLEIRKSTPLNTDYITLDPGGPPAQPLPENGTIPVSQTDRYVQAFEVLNKLDQRTQTALTSLLNQTDVALQDAPKELPGGLQATEATLSTFRPVVEALQTRRKTIEQLVTDLARISGAAGRDDERLTGLITSLNETLAALTEHDDELRTTLNELPGLTGDLKDAMSSVTELTTQLDPTLEALNRASEELPPALSQLTETLKEAGPVVAAAKPVVRKAKPVVADLGPLVSDLAPALDDLQPVTADLPNATAELAPWMPNLAAFVYHTSSSFSLADARGGLGRAHLTIDVTNPTGGLAPEKGTTGPEGGDK